MRACLPQRWQPPCLLPRGVRLSPLADCLVALQPANARSAGAKARLPLGMHRHPREHGGVSQRPRPLALPSSTSVSRPSCSPAPCRVNRRLLVRCPVPCTPVCNHIGTSSCLRHALSPPAATPLFPLPHSRVANARLFRGHPPDRRCSAPRCARRAVSYGRAGVRLFIQPRSRDGARRCGGGGVVQLACERNLVKIVDPAVAVPALAPASRERRLLSRAHTLPAACATGTRAPERTPCALIRVAPVSAAEPQRAAAPLPREAGARHLAQLRRRTPGATRTRPAPGRPLASPVVRLGLAQARQRGGAAADGTQQTRQTQRLAACIPLQTRRRARGCMWRRAPRRRTAAALRRASRAAL